MLKREGVGMLIMPDRPMVENKTFTCNHCDGVRHVFGLDARGYREEMKFWCDQCDAPVCKHCANDQRCVPFERQMEIAEARHRLWAAAGCDVSR